MNSNSISNIKKKEMKLSTFHKLPKDKLLALMKNLVNTYSWAWLQSELVATEKYGLDNVLEGEFNEFFREFGTKEGRKLVELSIVSGTDVDSIIKGLRHSHWALFENIQLTKLSDSAVSMRAINCSRQRYIKAKLGTEYPCKSLHFSAESRTGFVKAINPKAEVKCGFCPPDPRPKGIPENVSCEWIISIPS